MPLEDPRVYFASERTLLAWLRTGIAIIGIGFLVARFGLFLSVVRSGEATHPPVTGSTVIGTCFIAFGAILMALAAWQQIRFLRSLSGAERPQNYWTSFSIIAALLLAALSAGLAIYLMLV